MATKLLSKIVSSSSGIVSKLACRMSRLLELTGLITSCCETSVSEGDKKS